MADVAISSFAEEPAGLNVGDHIQTSHEIGLDVGRELRRVDKHLLPEDLKQYGMLGEATPSLTEATRVEDHTQAHQDPSPWSEGVQLDGSENIQE